MKMKKKFMSKKFWTGFLMVTIVATGTITPLAIISQIQKSNTGDESNLAHSSSLMNQYSKLLQSDEYINESLSLKTLNDNSINSQGARIAPLDRNLSIECVWTKDKNNRNITFYNPDTTTNADFEFALKKDLECEVSYVDTSITILKNQFPVFIFDDFVQNFFPNKKFEDANIKVTTEDCTPGPTAADPSARKQCYVKDNFRQMTEQINKEGDYVIASAKKLVGQMLNKLPFGPEISLMDSISFQNRVTSAQTEQGSNGIYRHVPIQNDELNTRDIKIIVDTYTEATKPLESDVNVETDFRFDVENAIHTLVHEYGHHLTLYSEQLTNNTFLATMKKFYTGAKLHDNSISCLSKELASATVACGNWDDYETMYKYANNYPDAISHVQALTLFRRLYGMTKLQNRNNQVSYPFNYEHDLFVKDISKNADGTSKNNDYVSKKVIARINISEDPSNNSFTVNTSVPQTLNDSEIHGAQQLSTLIPNAKTEYVVKNGLSYNYDTDTNTPADFKLNCQNEYFYFYGQSIDFDAFLSQRTRPGQTIDNSVLSTIKYYFSMEEQLARLYSIVAFQYEPTSDGTTIRPLSGCGFTYSRSIHSASEILDFTGEVRLENKQLVDHLSLKRFGIDAYQKSKELMSFFIPTKATTTNMLKFARYSQNNSQDNSTSTLYSFPKAVLSEGKPAKATLSDGRVVDYTAYPYRYKLLSLVNLSEADKKSLSLIRLKVDGISTTFRAIPYNYNNYFYYEYKTGETNTINPDKFNKKNTLVDNFGVVFDVGGKGLLISEIESLYTKAKLQSSTVFIDTNNNGVLDSGEKELTLSFN